MHSAANTIKYLDARSSDLRSAPSPTCQTVRMLNPIARLLRKATDSQASDMRGFHQRELSTIANKFSLTSLQTVCRDCGQMSGATLGFACIFWETMGSNAATDFVDCSLIRLGWRLLS